MVMTAAPRSVKPPIPRACPPAARPILDAARRMTDRQLLRMGRLWLRQFPRGYPPNLEFTLAAWRELGLSYEARRAMEVPATAIGMRIFVRMPSEVIRAEQCIRIAIEAACTAALLKPRFGPDDALTRDLLELERPFLFALHGKR